MHQSVSRLGVLSGHDHHSSHKLHCSHRSFDPCSDTLALILAGGQGTRLSPLTDEHCKPAVPFGGNYRIIDFSLSNCINSGIRRVGVLSQYKQRSLLQHLNDGWNFLRRDLNEFIDLMPASQSDDKTGYSGTADAVTQNLDIIRSISPKYTLILAGDHVYKADYRRMVQHHIDTGAAATVACVEVPRFAARDFGVVTTGLSGKITSFREKPSHPSGIPGKSDHALASMGIYVFNTDLLIDTLVSDTNDVTSTHDFGHDILPSLITEQNVMAYVFSKHQSEHYWRDVGTVDAYFDANMQLLQQDSELVLNDSHWPIRTLPSQLPAARFIFDDATLRGMASDSIVAAGCVLRGARVRHAVLFSNVHIHELSEVHNTLILPQAKIGTRCRIRNAIIDCNTILPDGCEIGFNHAEDRKRYHISEKGIVVVTAKDSHRTTATASGLTTDVTGEPMLHQYTGRVT